MLNFLSLCPLLFPAFLILDQARTGSGQVIKQHLADRCLGESARGRRRLTALAHLSGGRQGQVHLLGLPRTPNVKRAPRGRDSHLITVREVCGEGVELQQLRRIEEEQEEWMVQSLHVKSRTLLDPTALCRCSDTLSFSSPCPARG